MQAKGLKMEKQITSPLKAIRTKCLECCVESSNEVKRCHIESCALFKFRLGKNPYLKHNRVMSEEQRKAASERMKKLVEKQRAARAEKARTA